MRIDATYHFYAPDAQEKALFKKFEAHFRHILWSLALATGVPMGQNNAPHEFYDWGFDEFIDTIYVTLYEILEEQTNVMRNTLTESEIDILYNLSPCRMNGVEDDNEENTRLAVNSNLTSVTMQILQQLFIWNGVIQRDRIYNFMMDLRNAGYIMFH
jgi:hypothetical protein